MGELQPYKPDGVLYPRSKKITGSLVIGAAGAITSFTGSTGVIAGGFTVTKNATAGRYDFVLHRGYKRVISAMAAVSSVTAGNVPVVTDGNLAYVNGIANTNNQGTANITTFSIQCCTSNGVATAANPKSGDVVNFALELADL